MINLISCAPSCVDSVWNLTQREQLVCKFFLFSFVDVRQHERNLSCHGSLRFPLHKGDFMSKHVGVAAITGVPGSEKRHSTHAA